MRVYTKQTNFRCERLLDIARHAPQCFSCGHYNHGDVVAAHSNSQSLGKGTGIKAHDLPAYVCRICHDEIDGRTGGFSRDYREQMWLKAMAATMVWLFQEGFLKVVSK